jgi:N-acetyl-anhydromuramyl-L-alanine amidase AmpD
VQLPFVLTTRSALFLLLPALLGSVAPAPATAGEKPAVEWKEAYRGNYRKGRRQTIQYVVIHTIEGSVGSAVGTFQNRREGRRVVSAHYIVGHDGRIVQMVKDEDTAYHIRGHNGTSVGIEHEGWADRNTWTAEQYRASARLTRWLCDTYDIPIDLEHIVGHGDMPGQNHRHDPGRFFDWELYLRLIRELAPVKVLAPAADEVLGRSKVQPDMTVRWLASPEQTGYRVQVEDLETGRRYDSGAQLSQADRHTLLLSLRDRGRYRWRVTTRRGDDERLSDWTPFTVDLTAPTLEILGPNVREVHVQPRRMEWRCSKPGAPMAGFRVWVAERSAFGARVVDTLELNGPADRYQLPNLLEPGKTYVYRVMVHDGRGNQAVSGFHYFRTARPGLWNPPREEVETGDALSVELGVPTRIPGLGVLDALEELTPGRDEEPAPEDE